MAATITNDFKEMLSGEYEKAKEDKKSRVREFMKSTWSNFERQQLDAMLQPQDTTYELDKLKEIAKSVSYVPEGATFLTSSDQYV